MRLPKRRGPKAGRRNPPNEGPEWKLGWRKPVPKLAPERGAPLMRAPPRNPDDENPPRPIEDPPREPPCVWAGKGVASSAEDNAVMANQRRIPTIIAPAAHLNCQILVDVGASVRVRYFQQRSGRCGTGSLTRSGGPKGRRDCHRTADDFKIRSGAAHRLTGSLRLRSGQAPTRSHT